MLECPLTDGARWIAKRAELVFLILKEVGIDRSRADAEAPLQLLHRGNILQPVGQIPEHMERKGGRYSGQPVHFGGVGKLLLNGARSRSLHKLAEARAGVGESPRGNLDPK